MQIQLCLVVGLLGCGAAVDSPDRGADTDGDGYVDSEDCAPDDAQAYPGQAAFFVTEVTGHLKGPAFDFDCDGAVTQQHALAAVCSTLTDSLTCEAAAYRNRWRGPVPDCGEAGELMPGGCHWSSSCLYTPSSAATQACR